VGRERRGSGSPDWQRRGEGGRVGERRKRLISIFSRTPRAKLFLHCPSVTSWAKLNEISARM
jgi:hypothetical protein